MKLFLIPITRRHTLLYAQQLGKATSAKPSLIDRVSTKAAITWAQWERGEKKWQRSLVDAGNKLLRKIPYEEWGLKSVPPLSTRRKNEELKEKRIPVVFPPSIISPENVPSIIQRLATERVGLHRNRLWWSIIGMPIVAPFALVPLIPNIPFFYLAFRAYSHWKALAGGKHLDFLVKNNLLDAAPCSTLDAIYTKVRIRTIEKEEGGERAGDMVQQSTGGQDVTNKEAPGMLLITVNDAQTIAKAVNVPELAAELERAHFQVEEHLRKATGENGKMKALTLEEKREL